jgi:hypothetical protein
MKDVFVMIGLLTTIIIAAYVIALIILAIKELLEILIRNYRQKHRFSKAPKAKCYCVDCIHHNNKTGECYRLKGWHTADNWFCWNAEPRKKELKENANS